LAEVGLPFNEKTPVVGLVSRLVDQKGLDLIAEIMPKFLEQDAQLVVLGTGDPRYHQFFEDLKRQHPTRVAAELRFDNRLAKLIYAGSDLFLMPSRFEPCGLGQMIAMKYGTVPVVRKTGGLADSVENLSLDGLTGNGFVFDEYLGDQLFFTLRRGLEAFRQPKLWKELVNRAMKADFSWDASAAKYLEHYRKIAASQA
jgi:starch synthase